MRIGITAYDLPARELVDLGVAADAAGFDVLWLGEHLLRPVGYAADHPATGPQHHTGPIVGPDTELLDPMVALGAVAGATTRIGLATGMYILPLRHPLAVARASCTLQEVSGGRFRLGVGAGWLREEFAALDVPFESRGARLEEAVEVLRRAWGGGAFAHRGEHFEFDEVQVTPRPTPVPLVLGGNSSRALRRAATLGDGWFSSGTPSLSEAIRMRDELQRRREEAGRGQDPFRCYVRIEGWDPGAAARYAAAGFEDVAFWADQLWRGGTLDERRRGLSEAGAALGLARAPEASI